MKGGAIFNQTMPERRIRMLANMPAIVPVDRRGNPQITSEVYRSSRRLLLLQEITQFNYQDPDSRFPSTSSPSPQVGNIHGLLITLPETEGDATYDFYPPRNNYFRVHMAQIFRSVADALHHGEPNSGGLGVLVLKDEVSPKVRRRQLESVRAVGAKGNIPDVVDQKIALMAGLTAMPKGQRPLTTTPETATLALPLSDVQSALARDAANESWADAVIDAAIVWVKAWNVEHFAQKGKKKEATQARKQAERALDEVKAGRVPGSSSSSSSSSSAAPPPPPPPPPSGPTAAELEEERLSQEALAAMKGGRRKTKRSSKTRRTTRRA